MEYESGSRRHVGHRAILPSLRGFFVNARLSNDALCSGRIGHSQRLRRHARKRWPLLPWMVRLVIVLTLPVALAHAQTTPGTEVEVLAGVGPAWIFGDSIETDVVVRGGLGVRPLSRLGVEVLTTWMQGGRQWTGGGYDVTGVSLSGRALYYFSQARTQPYLLAGGGVQRWTRTSNLVADNGTPNFEETGTDLVPSIGVGVKAYVKPDLFIRVEGRVEGRQRFDEWGPALSIDVGYRW